MALFVFDIDMTLANGARRKRYAGAEPNREKDPAAYNIWRDKINQNLDADEPVPGMVEMVRAMEESGNSVVYVTARGSNLRSETREWLKRHGFPDCMLWMRAETDLRPSAKFKEHIISKLRTSEHEATVVVDDDERGELEEVCKRRGWTFLRALSGGVK